MSSSQLNLAESIHDFSSDLYRIIRDETQPNKNIILSPLSVQMALGLVMMGADGQTAREIASGLKLEESTRDVVSSVFEEFLASLQDNQTLKIANKVYVHKNAHLKEAFNEIATKRFYSETESMDFSESVLSANAINQWVESKTNHLIKQVISPDALSLDTLFVLVNAIYFKGMWKHPFPVRNTHKVPFYVNDQYSVEVDMMYMMETLPFANLFDLNAKAIQLPFTDSDMSMVVVLPNQRNGLATLDALLQTMSLPSIIGKMRKQYVDVSLPKFKVEFEISLPNILKKLGMRNMCTEAADFSALLEGDVGVYVSDVIHKAFIEVNEDGAEAAAVTSAVFCCLSLPPQFLADHGFKYYIMYKHHPVFVGDYANKPV